jgi:oligosaccharyltransferase complex subunit gamma
VFRSGFGLEKLHNWQSNLAPHPFPIFTPFNPIPYIVIPTTIIGGIIGLYFASPYIVPFIQSKAIWQGACLVAILIFTSGHMWNRIRGAPYQNRDGSVFAQGFSQQNVIETQVVGGICEWACPAKPSTRDH